MLHFKSIKKIHPPKTGKTRSSVSHTDMPPNTGCPVLGGNHTNCAFFTFVYFVFKKFLGAAFIYTDG